MKAKIRKIYFALGLIMFTFIIAQSGQEMSLNDLKGVTGNIIKVETRQGCVESLFDDSAVLRVIESKVDYNKEYNIVVIKGEADYYLLSTRNGNVIDSDGNPYKFEKNDIVCYENFPKTIEVME